MASTDEQKPPRVPPRWFVHVAWRVHRALNRVSGGRFLWTPANKRGWGALRLTTVGRRSGTERSVILGYLVVDDALVTTAMNGWGEGAPAWWLNLQADHNATVHLSGGEVRQVTAREATGAERDRLWQLWCAVDPKWDAYAANRETTTPVIVLETVTD